MLIMVGFETLDRISEQVGAGDKPRNEHLAWVTIEKLNKDTDLSSTAVDRDKARGGANSAQLG